MVKRFGTFVEDHKRMVKFWDKLSVLDPRNLPNCPDVSWENYENILSPEILIDDDDSIIVEKKKLLQHLKMEWTRYTQVLCINHVRRLHSFFF